MNEYGGGKKLSVDSRQFLIFSLAGEQYGVDVLTVLEIKGDAPITRIPNVPPEIAGLLNLRGAIVPVVDLRRKFGFEPLDSLRFAAIIVVMVQDRTMGVIVDSVSDVINIASADIHPPAGFLAKMDENVLQGIANVGEKLVILLDIEAVLRETAELAAAA